MQLEKHKRIYMLLWLLSIIFLCTGCQQSAYMKRIYEADSSSDGFKESDKIQEPDKVQESDGTKDSRIAITQETKEKQEIIETTESIEDAEKVPEESVLVVYICGAVKRPGVYELPQGARVIQAIEAAGGLREDADQIMVNQAKCLTDGEQIQILTIEEAKEKNNSFVEMPEENEEEGSAFFEESAKVNINQADAAQLMRLPGIGQAKADAIIKYRKTHGSFASIADIMNVSGIKESVFSKIESLITV